MRTLIKKSNYFTTYSDEGRIIVEDVRVDPPFDKPIYDDGFLNFNYKEMFDSWPKSYIEKPIKEKGQLHEIFQSWAEIFSPRK